MRKSLWLSKRRFCLKRPTTVLSECGRVELKIILQGSGCCSVGKTVASNTRGPLFESRDRQICIKNIYLPFNNCAEKSKIKKAHLKK